MAGTRVGGRGHFIPLSILSHTLVNYDSLKRQSNKLSLLLLLVLGVDQFGLELTEISLPLPPECWD